MMQQKDSHKLPPPLKLLGKRVLISLDLVPFMHMLGPLALSLVTLRNPPGMIYTKKIFCHLKRVLLQRTFRKILKNDQKVKFLFRGYQNYANSRSRNYPDLNLKIKNNLNMNRIKECFQIIQKYEYQNVLETDQKKTNFLESIPITLQKRRQSDFNSSVRIKKVMKKILRYQQNQEIQKCQKLYKNEFLKIRIPWTENIYQEIEQFGKQLWERYKNKQFDMQNWQKVSQEPNKKIDNELIKQELVKKMPEKGKIQKMKPIKKETKKASKKHSKEQKQKEDNEAFINNLLGEQYDYKQQQFRDIYDSSFSSFQNQ